MGVYEGRGQLNKAMKDLLIRWAEARGSWDDAASREFEARYLVPLEQDLKNAMSVMDHMAVVLQQVRHECE